MLQQISLHITFELKATYNKFLDCVKKNLLEYSVAIEEFSCKTFCFLKYEWKCHKKLAKIAICNNEAKKKKKGAH